MVYKFFFATKVWLTAAFGIPFLMALWAYLPCSAHYPGDMSISRVINVISETILIGGYGALFSIPSFAFLWVAAYLVTINEKLPVIYQKLTLSVAGIALTVLPFAFMGFGISDIYMIGGYAALITTGVWFYRLSPALTTTKENQTDLNSIDSQLHGNRQEALSPAEPEIS